MHEYKDKYEELQKLLPPPQATDGAAFTYELNAQQAVQHQMHVLILNTMINGMYEMIEECFDSSQKLLTSYDTAMTKYFRVQKFMKFETTDFGTKYLPAIEHHAL